MATAHAEDARPFARVVPGVGMSKGTRRTTAAADPHSPLHTFRKCESFSQIETFENVNTKLLGVKTKHFLCVQRAMDAKKDLVVRVVAMWKHLKKPERQALCGLFVPQYDQDGKFDNREHGLEDFCYHLLRHAHDDTMDIARVFLGAAEKRRAEKKAAQAKEKKRLRKREKDFLRRRNRGQ